MTPRSVPEPVASPGFDRRAFLLRSAGTLAVSALMGPPRDLSRLLQGRERELRLHANENPLGPAPSVLSAMRDAVQLANRYGAREALVEPETLEAQIASREGVEPSQVVLMHGSTEVLTTAAAAWGAGGVSSLAPSYPTLLAYAGRLGHRLSFVRPSTGVSLELDALRADPATPRASLVYLCNPDNPTGRVHHADAVVALQASLAASAVLVVDEAYFEYAEGTAGYRSMVELVRAGRRVVVARTFSKFHGLAGMRLGYAIAPTDLARTLRARHAGPPNVVGVVGARVALDDRGFANTVRRDVSDARTAFRTEMEAARLPVSMGPTNFAMVRLGERLGVVNAALRQESIRVWSEPWPGWMRMSFGTAEETARAAAVIRRAVAG